MNTAIILVTLLTALAVCQDHDYWVDRVWGELQQAVTCATCEILLGTLRAVAHQGPDVLRAVLKELCTQAKIADADVCQGTAAAQAPSVFYILEQLQIGSVTSRLMCASLGRLCPWSEIEFNLTLPPEPSSQPITRSVNDNTRDGENRTVRVVHLSDTHVDRFYTAGASYACSKPMCCRPCTAADAPNSTLFPCGDWGNPRCDPPIRLLIDSLLPVLQGLQPPLAFTLFTGDVVPHDFWLTSRASVEADYNTTYTALQPLTRQGPVYLAIGNHDTSPINIYPVSPTPSSNLTPQWAYDLFAYCLLYYRINILSYTTPPTPDPLSQFAWLTTELHQAERHHQRVWLLTHVPPGNSHMLPCYAHALKRIIERFRATIAAIFSGHRHLDLFQVYYRPLSPNNASTMRSSRMIHNTSRKAVAINYITPSLTSERGRPAFRIYDVDPATWAVVDYTVYVADYEPWGAGAASSAGLSHGHAADGHHHPAHGAAKLTWKKYYSAREAYGTRTEEDGNETLFEEWWARRTRGSWVTPCRGVCRRREICYMRGGPDDGEGEGWEGCPGSVLTTRGRHGHGVA
ncbi:PPN1 endopolyphosphatase family protein [Aspergillus brunneoviolaceus CBS 621.78]|uniref:Metallo-dependent phosphatase n=1 Tax=Aspergillus brunneoviolaceus CBS 621.78 TaxID=1450534 RepID=A0ACD1GCB5_9EURO|nr:Metallo-dependent phosphatase [Aspergillus brunneoviolaceus CBS 621.78]RAH46803.1 Metallo-dependent phosphatase [Aspergillus brunneoviolaceus CBS 621.78]